MFISPFQLLFMVASLIFAFILGVSSSTGMSLVMLYSGLIALFLEHFFTDGGSENEDQK